MSMKCAIILSMKSEKKSVVYLTLAAVFWSFGGVLAKAIPFSAISIAALRGVIAAITIGIYRKSFAFKRNKSIILAAISLTLTTVLFMVATKLTTATNAILLQYTSLFFIIILNWIFNHQKPKIRDILALSGIAIGISLFFVNQLETGNVLGNIVGLLSGLTFAGVFFANKMDEASAFDATFMGNLLSMLLIPFVLFDPAIQLQQDYPWVLITIMGVFQLGFGYIFFSLGIVNATATQSNITATLEPILNPIWVVLIIGEIPTLFSIVGGLIVLISVVLYNQFEIKAS